MKCFHHSKESKWKRKTNETRTETNGSEFKVEIERDESFPKRSKPLADATRENWNSRLMRSMSLNDLSAVVRKEPLFYACLSKRNALKNYKVNTCKINGCFEE